MFTDTEYIFSDPNLGIRKYDALADIFSTVLDVAELVSTFIIKVKS